MTDEEYWFWLCTTEGIYNESIGRLLDAYESPDEIYKMDYNRLSEDKVIAKSLLWNLIKEKRSGEFLRRLEKMKKSKINFLWFDSEDFPQKLKSIPAHPYCLFYKGSMPSPNLPSCAMVGARACSGYGKKAAVDFASRLAGAGVQIISGMAAGIDSISQKAALDAGGATFAVLGGGADVIYPVSNTELYYEIITSGGGIISEYPPGTASLAWQFPMRNRIISGLSDKLLIIEARKRSGTLSTARHALEQGKDIYALPGRITDPLSEGCNALIYDGAGILINPEYIVSDFFSGSETGENLSACKPVSDDQRDETGLLKYISYHAKTVDQIASEAKMAIEEVLINLAVLELEGRVKEVGKDYYIQN